MGSFEKGINAEKKIVNYLINKNCKILKTRFKTKYGEIDIIAENSNNTLLFVEVKYRNWDNEEFFFEVIQNKQKIRYYNAVQYFLYQYNEYLEYKCRFDVAAIIRNKIKYFKNAWSTEDIEYNMHNNTT